jgi:hypothetical protein
VFFDSPLIYHIDPRNTIGIQDFFSLYPLAHMCGDPPVLGFGKDPTEVQRFRGGESRESTEGSQDAKTQKRKN